MKIAKIQKVTIKKVTTNPIIATIAIGTIAIVLMGGLVIGIQYLTGNPPEFMEGMLNNPEKEPEIITELNLGPRTGASYYFIWKYIAFKYKIEMLEHDEEAKQIKAILYINATYRENTREYKGFCIRWESSGTYAGRLSIGAQDQVRYKQYRAVIHYIDNKLVYYEKGDEFGESRFESIVLPIKDIEIIKATDNDKFTRFEIPVTLIYTDATIKNP